MRRCGNTCIIHMCHDKKENKNISMTNFVQFYIISQHLCGIFKRHGVSIKWYSCHKHKCCPTSDVSLPVTRLTIKFDRLIVLSKSSLLGCVFACITDSDNQGKVPSGSIIDRDNQVSLSLIIIIKPFSPLLSQPFQF